MASAAKYPEPQMIGDGYWCAECADHVTVIERDGSCQNCNTILDEEMAAEYDAEAYQMERERIYDAMLDAAAYMRCDPSNFS